MPIISFSKKVLDEYVDTFSSNSSELLDPQFQPLTSPKHKEVIFTPLNLSDAEGYTEAQNKVMAILNNKPIISLMYW